MKKIGFLVAFFILASAQTAVAQCAMCRAVLETEDGGVKAEAVNDGIVYLMIFPYLLVGFALYFSYKVYKKKKS
ncbi:hypothetical protein [Myroides sp. WP-1]|uniref:hypothetical protein n=1 Tax=Myroides sp. WP-1 TaxID=2759944 RepID=UPI0015F787D7|nr:hypothetical protein [Myroides sp. WP-1]MBB1138341.1 hypothetical protein [Myroides sp. WP-1]